MVSVIVPTFNREKTILRAINSILRQTYKDIEVIIVDDCSNDNTEVVVKSLKNNNIIYVRHNKNKGACYARNTGIELAKGEYIAFLDSDDEWLPEKLQKQVDFLKNNNADIVFCSHISYSGNKKLVIPSKKICSNVLYRKLLYENFITTGSILGKSKCFSEIKFDKNLPRFQDWDLMINMGQKFSIQHLPEILTINYVQNDSITKNDKNALKAINIIYSKLLNLNLMDNDLSANFCNLLGAFAIKCNIPANGYFKESLSKKINIKTFIKYIICILGYQKILLKKY